MTERERIIDIIINGKLVGNVSIAELARAGNVDAQVAIYEGMQGNIREVMRASSDAIKAAKLPLLDFIEAQMILIEEKPLTAKSLPTPHYS
jgi:hypothetical protein